VVAIIITLENNKERREQMVREWSELNNLDTNILVS